MTGGRLLTPPSAAWLETHRRTWAQKPSLRAVYRRWFRMLREACVAGRIVEIGCGPGFLKELYPEVIATDVVPNPYADRIVEAESLPFADDELDNVIMLDVFHHLRAPADFLREAARVLRPGGRLVMIEPWTGLAGVVFYRWVHHETCDLGVPPEAPWANGDKGPMEGNAALPYLFFRRGGHLEAMGLPLQVSRRRRFASLPWLLSGGFQPPCLLPATLVPAIEAVDAALSLVPALTATRVLVVVERGR